MNLLALWAGFKALPFWVHLSLALMVLAAILHFNGVSIGARKEVIKQQRKTIEVERQVGAANEGAAAQRAKDAQALNKMEQELNEQLNETDPDVRAIRTGCSIMRQQGRDTSKIPACQRYDSAE